MEEHFLNDPDDSLGLATMRLVFVLLSFSMDLFNFDVLLCRLLFRVLASNEKQEASCDVSLPFPVVDQQ